MRTSVFSRNSTNWWFIYLLIYLVFWGVSFYSDNRIILQHAEQMPFYLTYIGALLVTLRHLFHYDGPIAKAIGPVCSSKNIICRFFSCLLYEQIFAVQLMIVSGYWIFLSHYYMTSVSIVIMHGGFCLVLFSDFLLSRSTFSLWSNLVGSVCFAILYALISYTGLLIFHHPIYPTSDWVNAPNTAFAMMAILLAMTLVYDIVLFYISKCCLSASKG